MLVGATIWKEGLPGWYISVQGVPQGISYPETKFLLEVKAKFLAIYFYRDCNWFNL